MEVNNEMNLSLEKIPTGIKGLDKIFFGGIQLAVKGGRQSENFEQGLIISVKGARGVDKTLLVLQMFHGLTKSLKGIAEKYSGFQASKLKDLLETCEMGIPRFYSLNKNEADLSDMLIDTLISRMSHLFTEEYLRLKAGGNIKNGNKLSKHFCDCLFCIDGDGGLTETPDPLAGKKPGHGEVNRIPEELKNKLDQLLVEETVYYSNRTNSLHIRRAQDYDDMYNRLCGRRSDDFGKYAERIAQINSNNLKKKKPVYDKILGELERNFFDVEFNPHVKNKKESLVKRYHVSSGIKKIQDILLHIENDDAGEKSFRDGKENAHKSPKCPCVVVDGITQLELEDLKSVNFAFMESVLRKNALVSILVFDEAEDVAKYNADIVIEMKREDDKTLNYTSHVLRISKCVFQPSAYGWHQYKKRDYGIDVFPSAHLLIQKRRHMSNILRTAHNDIFFENFATFYKKQQGDKAENSELVQRKDDFDDIISNYNLYEKRRIHSWDQLEKNRKNYLKELTTEDVLQDIFSDAEQKGIVTALIGPRNSYKRLLTQGYAFSACRKAEHTLMTLLDKDERLMVNQMFCPCWRKGNANSQCKKCFSNLHFFKVRMGCIASDEFLNCLKEQIELSCRYEEQERPGMLAGNNPQHVSRKRIRRVIIDDLERLDYSFPFLKQDKMFLSALISVCKDLKVDLLITSNEEASLTYELKTLADNVISTTREEVDGSTQIRLSVEKYCMNPFPSKIYETPLNDVWGLFNCKSDKIGINIGE